MALVLEWKAKEDDGSITTVTHRRIGSVQVVETDTHDRFDELFAEYRKSRGVVRKAALAKKYAKMAERENERLGFAAYNKTLTI